MMTLNPVTILSKSFTAFRMPEKMIPWLFFLVSVVFFSQSLSLHGIEYRDDEIFYYQSTNEMAARGNFLSPTYFGENRFQKPILFYWLVTLSYKIFGPTWFAARFVSVIFAGLTVLMTWLIGKELFDKKTATIGCLILTTLPLFFHHAKNAVPDMTLNFFIVWALYYLLRFFQDPTRRIYGTLFFISCGLGFMTKGFAALVIPITSFFIYALVTGKGEILRKINFPIGMLILGAIILPWFLVMMVLHGEGYLNYMVQTETVGRMISPLPENIFLKLSSTFLRNSGFYLNAIFSYFAPWCLFLIGALPYAIRAVVKDTEKRESFAFLLIWFFAGFIFFSAIAVRINHLILVVTTPFALLLSRFFLGELKNKTIGIIVKTVVAILVILGLWGLIFIRVILLGEPAVWAMIFFLILAICMAQIVRTQRKFVAPLILSIVILSVYSQATLLSKTRLLSHSCLQGFAGQINEIRKDGDIIAVGSYDIHEKELQVYFDRPVRQAATSRENETQENLTKLFQLPPTIYCLILDRDYDHFLGRQDSRFEVLKEDLIFRRRIYPDKNLFVAFLKFDRPTIRRYFMEKIILIRKKENA